MCGEGKSNQVFAKARGVSKSAVYQWVQYMVLRTNGLDA